MRPAHSQPPLRASRVSLYVASESLASAGSRAHTEYTTIRIDPDRVEGVARAESRLFDCPRASIASPDVGARADRVAVVRGDAHARERQRVSRRTVAPARTVVFHDEGVGETSNGGDE